MKSMLITKSVARLRDQSTLPSFKMIPLTSECPYQTCEYDTQNGMLVLISKEKKDELQTIPSIDDTGNYKKNKTGQPMAERRSLSEWFEVHLTDPEGIIEFINNMAINADKTSIYMPYLAEIKPLTATMEKPKSLILEA